MNPPLIPPIQSAHRQIARTLTRGDVLLLLTAARAFAAAMRAVDRLLPDPELRQQADRLDLLGSVFETANMVRES